MTVLWALLWGEISVGNLIAGLLVGVAVLVFAGLPSVTRRDGDDAPRLSLGATAYFAAYVLYKLVEANLVLAWEIVTPRNRINTGVVAVPLRTESNMAMMVVANVITLTPGTITIEAKGSPAVLYVQVLHLHDIERVRVDLLHIEELSVRAFGSPSARAQLAARNSS